MDIVNLSTIIILAAIIFINVFFGYWRSNTRRFSKQWLLAIHIPVPIAIGLRLSFLGWHWVLLPPFVGSFALGQYSGGQLRRIMKKAKGRLTSCLAVDLYRILALRRGES
jgi:hypothetical protein